jgi:hypothetical protein
VAVLIAMIVHVATMIVTAVHHVAASVVMIVRDTSMKTAQVAKIIALPHSVVLMK